MFQVDIIPYKETRPPSFYKHLRHLCCDNNVFFFYLNFLKKSCLTFVYVFTLHVCHYLTLCVCVCVCVCVCARVLSRFSHVQLFATPWTVAHQAPQSMGLSRQEYWSGLPLPSPGHLPDPGTEPMSLTSPALAGGFFSTSATWEAHLTLMLPNSVLAPLCTGLGYF